MATFTATVEVKGLRELDRMLARLPDVIEEKITREALAACGELIRQAAVNNIHSRTGMTAADIRAEIQQPKPDAGVVAIGGTRTGRTGRAHVLRWLEFGTRAHTVKAGDPGRRDQRRALRALRSTRVADLADRFRRELKGAKFKHALKLPGGVFRASAKIPGTAPQSPLTRALFENGERALKVYGDTIWAGIERVVPIIRAGG